MKYLSAILLSIFCLSCSTAPSLECAYIDSIVKKDQHYRQKHQNILSPYFYLLDSLFKANGYPEGIDLLSQYPMDMRQELTSLATELNDSRTPTSPQVIDSIFALQNLYDEENTAIVLDLIAKYGLHKMDTINNGCAMESLIVFVHSSEKDFPAIKEAIHPDLKQIDEGRYNHIMWHLEGR